jgi:hypothetical protein
MSENNPYAPPKADVNFVEQRPSIPVSIEKKIRSAWIAGLISAAVTLAFSAFGWQGFDLMNLLDVGLLLGLAFGVYKKSRACAVVLLGYFVLSKIVIVIETGKANGLIMSMVFLYFYWQGVVGTYQHRDFISRVNHQ